MKSTRMRGWIISTTSILWACLALQVPAAAKALSRENREAREWFQDAKFGMFIH
jgi:hypothetical protein